MRNPFRLPSPLALATQELETAQRELLLACTHAEHAQALVQYNRERIRRLRVQIADFAGEEKNENLGN